MSRKCTENYKYIQLSQEWRSTRLCNRHDDFNNMHGWFQKLLRSRAYECGDKETKNNSSSVSTASASSFCSSSSSSPSPSPGATPSKPLHPHSALSSAPRWKLKYDVFVCHSTMDSDINAALHLVSFLEASPHGLRCFLRQRDDCPGGAVSTELYQAVQNSHIWALLITPEFVHDEWCNYLMHQTLAEAPMSNRLIPLLHNLPRSQCPQELKYFYSIDLNSTPERGYTLLNKAVLMYLEELVKKEKTSDYNVDSSSNGLSSKTDQLMSEQA